MYKLHGKKAAIHIYIKKAGVSDFLCEPGLLLRAVGLRDKRSNDNVLGARFVRYGGVGVGGVAALQREALAGRARQRQQGDGNHEESASKRCRATKACITACQNGTNASAC